MRRGANFVPRLEMLERRDLLTGAELDLFDGSAAIAMNDTIDLGTTPVGTAVTRTLTIDNPGDADLDLDATSLSLPAGYSVVTPFATPVLACATTSLVLQADATALGTFYGIVSFASNDADESPFSFSVTIGVTAPDIDVLDEEGNPIESGIGNLDFGETTELDELMRYVIIANPGDGDLLLDATSLSLPSGFSLVGSVPSPIAPGDAALLGIQLDANSAGSFSGTVSIGTNDSDEDPFTFDVSGTVNANTDPIVTAMPDVVIPVTPGELSIDLWDYFSDAEDGSDLAYTIVGNSNPSIFNAVPEPERGYLKLSAAPGTAGNSSTLTIRGRDHHGADVEASFDVTVALPVISIVDRKHTGETATAGFFELKRDGDKANALTVAISLGGAAIIGTDYTTSDTTSVIFGAGEDTVQIYITPVDDSDEDGSEEVTLSLFADTATPVTYELGEISNDLLSVHDDDQGAFVFISQVQDATVGADGFFKIESIGKLPYQIVHSPDPSYTGSLPPVGGYYWYVGGVLRPFPESGSLTAPIDYLSNYVVKYSVNGTAGAPVECGSSTAVLPGAGEVNMGAGKCVEIPVSAGNNADREAVELELLVNEALRKITGVADSYGTYLGSAFVGTYAREDIDEPEVPPPPANCCGPEVKTWFKETLDVAQAFAGQQLAGSSKYNRLFSTLKYEEALPLMAVDGCGTGNCTSTVTLCGTCIDVTELGNIAYGYSSGGDRAMMLWGGLFAEAVFGRGFDKPEEVRAALAGFELRNGGEVCEVMNRRLSIPPRAQTTISNAIFTYNGAYLIASKFATNVLKSWNAKHGATYGTWQSFLSASHNTPKKAAASFSVSECTACQNEPAAPPSLVIEADGTVQWFDD